MNPAADSGRPLGDERDHPIHAAVSLGLGAIWLGILFLLKDEVLALLGEPRGEFMAVIPLGYPEREARGPGKKPLEAIVQYVD